MAEAPVEVPLSDKKDDRMCSDGTGQGPSASEIFTDDVVMQNLLKTVRVVDSAGVPRSWNQDTELHISLDLTNLKKVELRILEGRISRDEPSHTDHLYEIPRFDAFTASCPEMLDFEDQTLQGSVPEDSEWETMADQHFWVEVVLPAHPETPNMFRTCLAMSRATKVPAGAGSQGCYCYHPAWNECIVMDLSHFDIDLHQTMKKKLRPKATRRDLSYLNAIGPSSIQLTMVVYMNGESIGEISLPIKTLNSHEAWYPLNQVDKAFLARLQRTALGQPRWGNDWKVGKKPRLVLPPVRKLLSLRSALVLTVFIQIACVVMVTTVMMYFTAELQLQESARTVSAQVWQSIDRQLVSEFAKIEVMVRNTASTFYQRNLTQDEITRVLYRAFTEVRAMEIAVNASLLYMATPINTFFACGANSSLGVPSILESDICFVIKNTTTGPSLGYQHNTKCDIFSGTNCSVVDFSAPCCRNLTDFNATARPWYPIAANSTEPQWTDIYQTVTGDLSYTLSTRVPNVLSLDVDAIVAIDVFLSNIDDRLSKLTYYDSSGYGIVWNIRTGAILGSSLDGATTVQANGSFVRLNESAEPHIRAVGQWLLDVCGDFQPLWICPNPTNESTWQTMFIGSDIITLGLISNPEFPLVVAVVIPEAAFMSNFRRTLAISIGVSLGLVVLTLCVTVFVAHMLTRQIATCTKQLKKFAVLDFTQPVLEKHLYSPIKEICRIYDALQFIRTSLRSFFKFVPPDVVRQVVASGEVAQLANNKKKVITIMFSDIVDFTKISETLDLDRLLDLLRLYFEEMSLIILQNEGTVDKYIGDAVMVLFNAPETVIHHPIKACETALLCQARLHTLAPEWVAMGFPYVQARIGIHTGTCIVGNFGSETRLNYTALGDSVNLASRLEGLNKEYGTEIMISEDTYKWVSHAFVCRPLDWVAVKGKSRPSLIYELLAHTSTATPSMVERADVFTQAFSLYRARKFERAGRLFELYLRQYEPTDKVAKMHLSACREYSINPPPSTWNGVRHMTHK
eukprot:comp20313_c1_seq1/m.25530 comp20313_c1_seq1/g.25530  ORF comp20313_c1_seq1/g.25530 comp20313_c1_seq1/m.25530 type:complete len:1023 (-) comp20313_c1_seq1:458-3526(-)